MENWHKIIENHGLQFSILSSDSVRVFGSIVNERSNVRYDEVLVRMPDNEGYAITELIAGTDIVTGEGHYDNIFHWLNY